MKIFKNIFVTLVILLIVVYFGILGYFLYQKNKRAYKAEDFKIETLLSKTDYDYDGIDDYTDILQGAKIEAEKKPTYKSTYYAGRVSTRRRRSMYRCDMESFKKCGIFLERYGRCGY